MAAETALSKGVSQEYSPALAHHLLLILWQIEICERVGDMILIIVLEADHEIEQAFGSQIHNAATFGSYAP